MGFFDTVGDIGAGFSPTIQSIRDYKLRAKQAAFDRSLREQQANLQQQQFGLDKQLTETKLREAQEETKRAEAYNELIEKKIQLESPKPSLRDVTKGALRGKQTNIEDLGNQRELKRINMEIGLRADPGRAVFGESQIGGRGTTNAQFAWRIMNDSNSTPKQLEIAEKLFVSGSGGFAKLKVEMIKNPNLFSREALASIGIEPIRLSGKEVDDIWADVLPSFGYAKASEIEPENFERFIRELNSRGRQRYGNDWPTYDVEMLKESVGFFGLGTEYTPRFGDPEPKGIENPDIARAKQMLQDGTMTQEEYDEFIARQGQ